MQKIEYLPSLDKKQQNANMQMYIQTKKISLRHKPFWLLHFWIVSE